MISILRDQRVGEQARTSESLVDGPRRRWCLHDPIADIAAQLGSHVTEDVVLEGGWDGWWAAGKPLAIVERQPWSMERQVRTTAGSLVLLTIGLAYAVSPLFLFGTSIWELV